MACWDKDCCNLDSNQQSNLHRGCINSYPLRNVYESLRPLLDKSESCKDIDWTTILRLIALIILLILLAPILPYIFSFIITLISLPFKLLAKIFEKIKKDGDSSGKKT